MCIYIICIYIYFENAALAQVDSRFIFVFLPWMAKDINETVEEAAIRKAVEIGLAASIDALLHKIKRTQIDNC